MKREGCLLNNPVMSCRFFQEAIATGFFCAVCLIAITASRAVQADDYNISDLGVLTGGTASLAISTSADGSVVVGASDAGANSNHAVKWTGGAASPTDINPAGYLNSAASDVSADGEVIVGWAQLSSTNPQEAVIWNGSTVVNIGQFTGAQSSSATAISDDKTVIVGWAWRGRNEPYAVKWTGNDYETATALSLLLPGTTSEANDVSEDGSVIVGWADTDTGYSHAVKWAGAGSSIEDLGTLGGEDSAATALSADGTIIVGWADTGEGYSHAAKWTEGGSAAEDLGTLGGDESFAYGISADGTVIVGEAETAAGDSHASFWTDDATGPADLGTFGGDYSAAYAASADGSIIVGEAETDAGASHAALWKRITPGPDPYARIDVTNTARTVAWLANDAFSVMEMQRLALGGLQRFCDVKKAGETCYSLMADAFGFNHNRDVRGHFALAHAFSDHFSAGASLSYSLWRDMPHGFKHNDKNIGVGVFARWKEETRTGHWYLRGSVAANRYDVDRTRRVLGYTEAGKGASVIRGWGAALELGRLHNLADNAAFGYYGGLRYSDLRMGGYTETNAHVPFTYSSVDYALTTAYAGVKYGTALTDRTKWSVNAEIGQDLSHKDPTVTARADYIGTMTFDAGLARTRGSLSTTISYAFSDQMRVEFTPYVVRTAARNTGFGVVFGLSGTF